LGDLERREVVAIFGNGVDGRLKLLSMWLAPSARSTCGQRRLIHPWMRNSPRLIRRQQSSPHFREFITSSTLWHTTINGDAREIRDDHLQILREHSNAEILAHLERSRMKWSPRNDRYPKIHESWTVAWGTFAPFFALTEPVRKVVLELDSRLQTMSQAFSLNSDKLGAFESEMDALGENLVSVRNALKEATIQ